MQKILGVGRRLVAWVKRHRRILTIVGIGILVLSILAQLLWPSSRALPFTSAVGERTDFKTREDIVALVQGSFDETSVSVVTGDKEYSDDLSVFGASIDSDQMASDLLSYPLVIRFLPLSVLWYHPQVERFALEFSDSQLQEVAKQARDKLTSEPRNASLAIKDGELEVEAAANGRLVSVEMVLNAVKQSSYTAGKNNLSVQGERTIPRVSDESIAAVKKQAEDMLARRITIVVDNDREFTPSRENVAQWVTIKTDDKQAVSLVLSTGKIAEYLKTVNQKVQIKPGVTTVSLRDGKEQSRKKGSTGRAIPTTKSANKIRDQLMTTQDEAVRVDLSQEKVEPTVKYTRSYSSSQAGLTAYVEYTTSGDDIKIAVRQLNGDGYFSYGSAADSIPSASTYKLYVMLRLFDDINQGKRKWDDQIVDDSLSTCFERMIVVSANNCAEELISQFGTQKLTDYLHGKGFSNGTGFNFSDATHTTAADLLKMLIGIENGSIVSGQNRNMLLEKMSRQIYRNGIPAGSAGTVYDKVGFLWGYNNDAAVVRHPQGTYALAVMTKGHSFAKIAEITRQIERIMYP